MILFYWMILLLFTLGIGNQISHLLGSNRDNILFDFINALFFYLLLAWIASYFIGVASSIVLIILTFFGILSIYFLLNNNIHYSCLDIFKNNSFFLFFILLIINTLFISSLMPILRDNETYYVQTIKWAGKYGFVPGLINLHPFLGQFSGWHILQAAFFSFGNRFFNDLNGALLLIFSVFSLKYLQDLSKKKNNNFLLVFMGFQILLIPVYLFFLNAPSPDLPVFILAQIIFFLFIINYQNPQKYLIFQLIVFVFFALLIKLTAFPLIFLPLILIYKNSEISSIKLYIFMFLLTGILLISKNYILTGYPFYPFNWFSEFFSPDWKYPKILKQTMNILGRRESLALSFDKNIAKSFFTWLLNDMMHGFFHVLWIFFLILIPFLWRKSKIKEALKIIYFLGLIYFLVLLFINPNNRFYGYFIVFFGIILFATYYYRKISVKLILGSICVFLVGINIYFFKHQKHLSEKIFWTDPVSRYSGRFQQKEIGNLKYFYPDNPKIFWETGNSPLPSVSSKQINYFKKYYGFYPQKRKNRIKTGFYSKYDK